MIFWKNWFGQRHVDLRIPQPPQAIAGMAAQPLVITQGAPPQTPDKVAHAKYRLDAIKRTIEQDIDGRISKAHLSEFVDEIRELSSTLVKAGVSTDEEIAALVREIKGLR